MKDGKKVSIVLPRYAINQSAKASLQLDHLLSVSFGKLMAELKDGQDSIVSCTLEEAIRRAHNASSEVDNPWAMLSKALKISIITRLASKSFSITGSETLGRHLIDDATCPYYRLIPISPLLDAQIDSLWIQKMRVLQKSVLLELKGMILTKIKRDWFKIFLTIMVLLTNLEFLYQNQDRQLKRYNKTV